MKTLPDPAVFGAAFTRLEEILGTVGTNYHRQGEVAKDKIVAVCEQVCDGHLVIARRSAAGNFSFEIREVKP